MEIINNYHNRDDIGRITSLACACLTAIRRRRSGETVYAGTAYVNRLMRAAESGAAV